MASRPMTQCLTDRPVEPACVQSEGPEPRHLATGLGWGIALSMPLWAGFLFSLL